ncbi:MAG: Hsp70 family protein [Bacteroidota bacterium]
MASGSAQSLLILGVSALVATCAVLSALGFRGRASTVGIDLGTTYSVIAISDARAAEMAGLKDTFVPAARVIAYEDGEVLTPSVVGFDQGRPVVGRDVAERREEDLWPVVRDAKRFIGRAFEDAPAAREYQFRVVRNGSRAAFELGGASVLPEDIGALVVRRLVEEAKRDLGHDVVTSAVIAVPAAFGADQIRATADAFKLAGLRVARILKEPVAAAVAYGLNKKPGVDHVLVYDFGGGTLDVSVLYVQDGSVEVVANHGDNDLGGTDFDHCLLRALQAALAEDQSAHAEEEEDSASGEDCGRASVLLRLAEALKIELSAADSATIRCRGDKTLTVTREAFETALCGHLFARAVATVHETLETSMIRTSDIDEVVLVGGTSRIPKVRSDLRTALGVTKLNTDIDPDVTVAVGAASVID